MFEQKKITWRSHITYVCKNFVSKIVFIILNPNVYSNYQNRIEIKNAKTWLFLLIFFLLNLDTLSHQLSVGDEKFQLLQQVFPPSFPFSQGRRTSWIRYFERKTKLFCFSLDLYINSYFPFCFGKKNQNHQTKPNEQNELLVVSIFYFTYN